MHFYYTIKRLNLFTFIAFDNSCTYRTTNVYAFICVMFTFHIIFINIMNVKSLVIFMLLLEFSTLLLFLLFFCNVLHLFCFVALYLTMLSIFFALTADTIFNSIHIQLCCCCCSSSFPTKLSC